MYSWTIGAVFVPGEEAKVQVFGKVYDIPRKQATYGDAGLTYTYSRVTRLANSWTPTLEYIRDAVTKTTGQAFNFVLVNRWDISEKTFYICLPAKISINFKFQSCTIVLFFKSVLLFVILCCIVGGAWDIIFSFPYLHCSYCAYDNKAFESWILKSVLLASRYKDGQDHMGEHRDDEKELDPLCPIASVSLGAPRDFIFRHRDARGKQSLRQIEPVKLELAHGSLLLMNSPTNTFWYHSLPVRKKSSLRRINLTFRRIALDRKKWPVGGLTTWPLVQEPSD